MNLIDKILDNKEEFKTGDKVKLIYMTKSEAASNALNIGDILEVVDVNVNASCKNSCNNYQKKLCDDISKDNSILFMKKERSYIYRDERYMISSCYCKVERI